MSQTQITQIHLTFLDKTEFTKPGQGTWLATRKSRQQRLTASFKTVCDCISLSFSTSSILKESGLVATFQYKQTALNHRLYIMPKHPIIIACRPQIFPQVLRYPTKPAFCQHGLATHHQFQLNAAKGHPYDVAVAESSGSCLFVVPPSHKRQESFHKNPGHIQTEFLGVNNSFLHNLGCWDW